jgi:hypothetical protein
VIFNIINLNILKYFYLMNKVRNFRHFNIDKYIDKLKKSQAPGYVIGKEGLSRDEFYHPAFDRTTKFPKELQISEFYGKMDENHNYFNENYKNLLLSLKEIDQRYASNVQLESRIKLAKDAITHWKNFVEISNNYLPAEQFKVRDDILIKLKDIWMRFKVNSNIYI